MSIFDFIVDKELRTSLESDWKELQGALQTSAWKSVHVLAGNIVEAILIDHLLQSGQQTKDPLKMTLEEAIAASKAAKVLSEKTSELSTVIRRYRNLIHPGRMVRLSEVADADGAAVCEALVRMISGEVTIAKSRSYGYTAEQIASKVERDSSSVSILSHLLRRTKEVERARLLLEILPERYFSLYADPENWVDGPLTSIEKAFHLAFETASGETKTKVAQSFMKVLHEDDEAKVLTYERVFFRSNQLEYLDNDEKNAVKQHISVQLKDGPTRELFEASRGIGRFLEESEVLTFLDAAVRLILDPKQQVLHPTCEQFIGDLYRKLPSGPDQAVNRRLEVWVTFLKERNREADASRVQALVIDVPF